ncbi:MAG TPA: hypothetical protein VFV77_08140 [Gammaproteobacteria bacterium]|nr:hypothetical protein [Gammaproteobacteria bacterium]
MRRLVRLLAALFAVSLLLGNSNCSKNNASDAPQFVTTLQVENSSGQVSGGFSQGDTVNLVLTIRNRSSSSQTLFFNSSEFANFAVVNAGTADVVWTCDGDVAGIAAATCTTTGSLTTPSTGSSGSGSFVQIDFAAFQSRTITFTWTGLDNNGNQLAKGSYEVLGGFTVYNTAGPGSAADNGSSMAEAQPTAAQMFPTVYRSVLLPFTIQ